MTPAPTTKDAMANEQNSPVVAALDLDEMTPTTEKKAAKAESGFGRVLDVAVALTARIGTVKKTISDILDLAPGSVIDLERNAGDPVDVVIGDKLIARGEIVIVDERYGIRITEVVHDPA